MSRCRSFLPDLMTVRAVMVRAEKKNKLQATSLAGKSTTAAFCSGILLWLVIGDIFRYLSMVEKAIIHPLLQHFAGVSINLNLGRLTNHLVKN